jgi:muconate/chloromuconate cycloisomerase
MIIEKVELIMTKIPVARAHVMAIGTSLYQENVVLKVYTDDGVVGLGEAPHMVGISSLGESPHTVSVVLQKHVIPRILKMDPMKIEAVQREMNRAIPWNFRAKSAVNLACYDIVGKTLKTPVYSLLGGKYRDRLLLSSSIPITDHEKGVKEALEREKQGYKVLKQKIGRDPDHDVEAVKRLRDALGYDFKLRADANQGYSLKTAIKTIRRMERYELEFVEQPTSKWDLDAMAEVSRAVEVPIMADEPVVQPLDALRIIQKGAAQYLSVYVCRPGGIINSKKIAAVAEAHGMECYIGGALEGPIGACAGLHLGASTPNITLGCEVGGQFLLLEDVGKNPIEFVDGCLKVPDGIGLGVELDEEKLEKVKVMSTTIS